jgi:heat shock protein HslJ
MTDEQMDARLRSAGESWRAATTPAGAIESTEVHALTDTPGRTSPRRRRTGLFASAAIVAAALVAGGSVVVANLNGDNGNRATDVESASLEGTVWGLVGWDGDPPRAQPVDTLYIGANGEFVASDDCVLLTAHAEVSGDTITFSRTSTRYLGCIDSYGPSIMAGFQQPLTEARYTLEPDGMTLRGVGDHALHFVPAPELPAPTADFPTFTDTQWRLVRATDAHGTEQDGARNQALRVEGGRFAAGVSCNTVRGDVAEDGRGADLKAVESTALPCPAPLPADEVLSAVFQPGQVQTEVQGTRLTISRDGAGTLTYEWVPADADATDPGKLTDRLWHATSVAGSPVDDRVVLDVHSDGTVTGYDGCREIDSAQAQVDPGSLTITGIRPGDFSSANCNSDLASTVDSLLTQDPALWRIAEDGSLVINGPANQTFPLVFQLGDPHPAPDPNQPPSLTGTPWNLVTAKDAAGNDVRVAGAGSFQIDADGHVTGNDACNYLSGDARIVDGTIEFPDGLAVTEMACLDDGVMATAKLVDSILNGTLQWSVDANRLTLHRDGAGTLVYQGGTPPTTSTDPADLIGTDWTLTTIETGTGPDGAARSANDGAALRIVGNRVNVDGVCMILDVQVGAGSLTVGSQDYSTASCIAPLAEDLEAVRNVLVGDTTWQITDGQLTITKDGVGALVYTRRAHASGLSGTPWTFTSIQTENANSGSGSGSPEKNVVLTIRNAGHYRLETGCHVYEGTATVSGQTVTFSNQRDLGGDDCLNTFAQQLVDFLDGTMTSSIVDGTLTLAKGNTTATFTG